MAERPGAEPPEARMAQGGAPKSPTDLPIHISQRKKVVPEAGLEPARPKGHWILSPGRLPIPPLRHQRRGPHGPIRPLNWGCSRPDVSQIKAESQGVEKFDMGGGNAIFPAQSN